MDITLRLGREKERKSGREGEEGAREEMQEREIEKEREDERYGEGKKKRKTDLKHFSTYSHVSLVAVTALLHTTNKPLQSLSVMKIGYYWLNLTYFRD